MSIAISDMAPANTPQPSALRADSLADTVLILLTLTLVQRLVGFGRSVLLCRWLDPEQLGQWDLALGFLVLAAPAAVLGLPGSFRRYVEHYRQRGQLQSFLRQTLGLTAALTLAAVAIVGWASPWFSELIFGRDDCVHLVRISAGGLALIIAHNVLTELFSSLRLFRIVSLLQFLHSVLFAVLSLALIRWWRTTADSVVIAYALACLICGLVAMTLLGRTWNALPEGTSRLSQRSLLTKLMPFAIWVWATDWLTNVFDIATRYMIVHHSGLDAAEALAQVGNYHSARVVPMLLVTISGMLASAALPHMSHDWERGERRSVSDQINLMLKLVVFGLTAGGVAILLAEPLLFDVAFGGKYSGGRAILPFMLTACVWFGVIGATHTYLCCAERAMLSSLAVLVGILVNVGLNLVLLPRYGLTGAVAATAAGNITTLSIALCFCLRWGLRFDQAAWFMLALPMTLSVGPWMAIPALGAVALWAMCGNYLLSAAEKAELLAVWRNYSQKLPRFSRPLATSRSP